MTDHADLAAWWPHAEVRLRAVLRHRAFAADVDDIVAETAARAVEHGAFESQSHLIGWAVTVATNVMRDEGRRARRRSRIDSAYVDRPYSDDVGDVVAELAKRDALERRIGELSEQRRAAFLGELTPIDARDANRIRVMKCRTAKELRDFYGRLGAAIGAWRSRAWARMRSGRRFVPAFGATGLAIAFVGGVSLVFHFILPPANAPSRAAQSIAHAASTPASEPRAIAARSDRFETPRAPNPHTLRVGLGAANDGRPRHLDAGPARPTEEGVLACFGEPESESARCLYWPESVQALARKLSL